MARRRRVSRERRRRSSKTPGGEGFSLLEVMAALGLLAAVAMMATSGGVALTRLGWAARGEAVGLFAAEEKIEELLSLPARAREAGYDDVDFSGIRVRRVWRLQNDAPVVGLTRLEVSTSWETPDLTLLTLVAVAP